MAHGVTKPIVLQQALHGYADGHRLLASSISLKPREAKIILTLSDASGPTANIAETGYVTGYPLPDVGLYALAKTWPAPEMPRPGCVWTHTLLIDFADLAAITDLSSLADAFVRPSPGVPPVAAYGAEVTLANLHGDTSGGRRIVRDFEVLRRLLVALYGRPRERVFSTECEPEERESVVYALWSQQWPRLRRSFRFCTLIMSDRSSETATFDLQFGARDERSLRTRAGKLFDAEREYLDEAHRWLGPALRDILSPGPLRAFLRGLGAELDGGRDMFQPLSELHDVLCESGRADVETLHRGVQLLEGPLKPAEARDARAQVVRRIADAADKVDEVLVDFCMRHLPILSEVEFDAVAPRVGIAMWRTDPARVVDTLAQVGRPRSVAVMAIASRSAKLMLDDLVRQPDLARAVLEQRRELLSVPALWGADALQAVGRRVAFAEGLPEPSVLAAMIEGGTDALVRPVCDAAGRDSILNLLTGQLEARRSEQPTTREARWFAEAATPNAVAVLLSRDGPRLLTTLVAIAHRLGPDDVPNDDGEDPVLTALRRARGGLSKESSLFLWSWVLARAVGDRTRNKAELFAASFEPVYLAALADLLPEDAWKLLERRLPDSILWSNWDRGRRLRAGVLNAFVGQELDPGAFGELLPSADDLFAELASDALWLLGGRAYLRRVKRALRDADSRRFATRISKLSRLL